jgi:hypothetical protein
MLPEDSFSKGLLTNLINKNWESIRNSEGFFINPDDLTKLFEIIQNFEIPLFERIAETVNVPSENIHNFKGTENIEQYIESQERRYVTYFGKPGFLLYDGLHAAGSVLSYIYRAKGERLFLFDDGILALCSVHSQIDEDGFSLHHDVVDEVPFTEFQKLNYIWKKLNILHEPVPGTQDLHFLIYSLTKINVAYEKSFFLEYLVNPADVQVVSRFSSNIASSLWSSVFDYIIKSFDTDKLEDDPFINFVLDFMKRAEVNPYPDDLLQFFKNTVQVNLIGKSPLDFSMKMNRMVSILEKTFEKPELTREEVVKNFKKFVERQASKDIYVNNLPQENIARTLLQGFLTNRSYREVQVRGGQSDILEVDFRGRYLYETKIWRGLKNHEQGIREIEEYIIGEDDDEELKEIFYVVFDPTKNNQASKILGGEITTVEANGRIVKVIVVNIALPKPSKKL